MELEIEKQVMNAIYLAGCMGKSFIRFNEIAYRSGVKKPTLQRILPRLAKRGWVRRREEYVWPDGNTAGGIFHLTGFKHPQTGKEVWSCKEIVDDYEARMKDLETKKVGEWSEQTFSHNQLFDPKYHRRDEWKRTVARYRPRAVTVYSLVHYPFLFSVGNVNEPFNIDRYWGTPEGARRFWKHAARQVIQAARQLEMSLHPLVEGEFEEISKGFSEDDKICARISNLLKVNSKRYQKGAPKWKRSRLVD